MMEILDVSADEFSHLQKNHLHAFASSQFCELNKEKCTRIHYLIFSYNGNRLSIVLGVRENCLYSPFSAPFGGFTPLTTEFKFKYLDDALSALITWARENGYNKIAITLPPPIYNSSFISKQTNSMIRSGFVVENFDINFHFDLDTLTENYSSKAWYNARKNLKIGRKSALKFHICGNKEEAEQAFEIIAENRNQRGFPLRMTWNDVYKTIQVIKADFFILKDTFGNGIAAALVFHVTADIVQVIYWGDLPQFSSHKTMNVLAFNVFEYYKIENKKIIDIGPSTENSMPNFGLCEFKESLGCDSELKLKLTKTLS